MNESLNTSDDKLYKTNTLTKSIYLKALERSLLILGAFVYFNIMNRYKKYIVEYVPYGKKYYTIISLICHLIFIFSLDLFLLYIFAFVFGIPI
jgi:hypothetical protein